MPRIYVDGKAHDVADGQNLLQACLSLGLDLPYFCWHPVLHSVGACRQCAVKQFKDENDTRGKIVMACMTPVSEGARISIDDPQAREFRASVVELLMANHPHDCPVCDEGGECHLQDMTVMTGHVHRRFRFEKRTHRNQDLGPFIAHEMNRCIACYRCVRFYNEYAGGRDLGVFGWHNDVYFGRETDGVLEGEFSGNLVEVCPTGVFTDKTLARHYTRKWDLQTAPSICAHCGLGCNTIPGARYGELRRIRNRYNGDVNGYFLCDRGRYGYEFVNSQHRICGPLMRPSPKHTLRPADARDALDYAREILRDAGRAIGVGSPRASLEANFALRALVGPERFYSGLSSRQAVLVSLVLEVLGSGPARTPTLREVETADAVLVLGEDVPNTGPRLALALRQAARQKGIKLAESLHVPEWNDAAVRDVTQQGWSPLFIATPAATRIDELATRMFRAAPDDLARLGFAVAQALDSRAPAPADLSAESVQLAAEIAAALRAAEHPLIVSGMGCGSAAVIEAAANVAWALHAQGRAAMLSLVVPECNTIGAGLLGGGDWSAARAALESRAADTLIVLENDLYRRMPPDEAEAFLSAARHVVVLDHTRSATTERAEVLLPAATFAESTGTFMNSEGRAQRFYEALVGRGGARESWHWLAELSRPWAFDELVSAIAAEFPVFARLPGLAPAADFRIAGQRVARDPHRYSGRTAMYADVTVHEPQPPADPDSPLAFSMEGFQGQPPPPLVPRFWAPGWNSVQSLNKFQSEVGGPLRGGDPGLRLIEPAPASTVTLDSKPPAPFARRAGEVLLVPLHHVFGSEELSVLSPGVAALSPAPYVALRSDTARDLGLNEGDMVQVTIAGVEQQFPVKPDDSLPAGVAGLPVGLPGTPELSLPQWGKLRKAVEA
jgi:NADH-quinone oxidoreductase subunit G